MADLFSRAGVDVGQRRLCSKCGEIKPLAAYAPRRAHCRICYNIGRRAHYAIPEVQAEKNEKRRVYLAQEGVSEAIRERRQRPEGRARNQEATRKYKATPGVKDRIRLQRLQHISNPEVKAGLVFNAARHRAKKKGLTFDLSRAWVSDRIRSGVCELTGIPFDYGQPKNGCRKNPFTPSIDRVSSFGGYTEDNCRLVLTAVNIALGQWGLEVLTTIAVALARK